MATCILESVSGSAVSSSLHSNRPSEHSTLLASLKTSPSSSVLRKESSLAGCRFAGVEVRNAKYSHTRPHVLRIEAAKRVTKGRNYVLSSTLVVQEGKEDAASALCKNIMEWAASRKEGFEEELASQAKLSISGLLTCLPNHEGSFCFRLSEEDRASGMLQFDCNADAFEPNVIHFWERYQSFTAMNDTRASPEHCSFMNEVRPLLTSPVALAAYEYKDGQIGCMMNPIGPKGEGGLDDATGQGGSGGGASYKQSSASVTQGFSDRGDEKEGAWGMKRALELSSAKGAAAQLQAAQSAAAKIASGIANLFGKKK